MSRWTHRPLTGEMGGVWGMAGGEQGSLCCTVYRSICTILACSSRTAGWPVERSRFEFAWYFDSGAMIAILHAYSGRICVMIDPGCPGCFIFDMM